MNSTPLRSFGPAALIVAALCGPAAAQFSPPQSGSGQQSQICLRLESQLTAFDRGAADPARAEQIKRYEDSAGKQQFELDRTVAQSRRIGCEGFGFFALFGGQPAQCGPLNAQIQQMRGNLDRIFSDLERLRGGSADRETQRRSILIALGQNDCGPQYRAAVQGAQRGFFDQLFGGGTIFTPNEAVQSSTFRTVCVRICDGFYFPISYSTVPSRFRDDERSCQRMCPAADTALFTHRNPGEDMAQAVSITGRNYTELPNAFRYRREYNPACGCKQPGQTWAEALNDDRSTLERGDIVVTEERAKTMSQPRLDAQGRPLRPSPHTTGAAPPAAASEPSAGAAVDGSHEAPAPGKRTVRSVGPIFLPAR